MGKVQEYQGKLRSLDAWDDYLLCESRLPGPRANLELAFAVALEGSRDQLLRYAALDSEQAPRNTQEEFLAVCGVISLGYLAARGEGDDFLLLRVHASDPRWRIREAVALGLQKYGQVYIEELLELMTTWSKGSLLERRAVVATLCEPGLLVDPIYAARTLDLIDGLTAGLLNEKDRRAEDFKVLRKALAYGWSVIVAAQPAVGKPRMEKWIGSQDNDIRWIMKQNLRKKRLSKMDASWVQNQLKMLE